MKTAVFLLLGLGMIVAFVVQVFKRTATNHDLQKRQLDDALRAAMRRSHKRARLKQILLNESATASSDATASSRRDRRAA